MSLLDHLKKHKKKYLVGLTTGLLAAGTGVGVHKYKKYKQQLSDANILRNTRLLSHVSNLSKDVSPHLQQLGKDLAFYKGANVKLTKDHYKHLRKRLWHGQETYINPETGERVIHYPGTGTVPKGLTLAAKSQGLKDTGKHFVKSALQDTALHKLSDVLVNLSHGDKWNSHKHAMNKLTVDNYVNSIRNAFNNIRSSYDDLKQSYELGKQYRTK